MKKLITILLMITIQVTFMQKVMASVSLVEDEIQTTMHCKVMMMSHLDCSNMNMATNMSMQDCNDNCEMMNVVSITHFIENTPLLSFTYNRLNYLALKLSILSSLPKSLYRPPLFS